MTNTIHNPELDEMLKQAFLDLDLSKAEDSRLMDEMASQVLNKDWPAVAQQSEPLKGKPAVSVSNTWIWILSGVALVAGLGITALLPGTSKVTAELADAALKTSAAPAITAPETEASKENVITSPRPVIIASNDAWVKQPVPATNNTNKPILTTDPAPSIELADPVTEPTPLEPKANDPAAAPDAEPDKSAKALSTGELEKHKKDLKTLDETFAAMKMSDYSQIELAPEVSAAKGNFLLKKTEVTIKEYRLFLTDLLANGKTEEYEMARPKPENSWNSPKDKNNKAFLGMYFRKARFENNPVICISTGAMEMYCQWMQERMEAYFKRGNEKVKVTVRLPRIEEWKYVASEGNKHHVYGTANGKLKDNFLGMGQHWNANFIETQEKFVAVGDSLIVVDKKTKTPITNKVSHNGFIGPARAYPASLYDVFNMSGNVSEIVTYADKKGAQKYRSIGGNWNSTGGYLKINAPDEFNGNTQPSPYIGFRPVIVIEK